VTAVTGTYRRMLTQKMDATAGARYFHDVSTTVASRTYNNFSINAGLNYKLTKSFNASAQYSFLRQAQSQAFLIGSSPYNANIIGASVNYTWNHPLGR
jgi:uncharacterized protein (PEP-CTERM system associated)